MGGMDPGVVGPEGFGERTLGCDEDLAVGGDAFDELYGKLVADAADVAVVVGGESGKAQDEKGPVGICVACGDVAVGREMVRMEVGQFVVAVVGNGFAVPAAVVAAIRAQDGGGPRVGQPGVQGDDGGIVLVHVDGGDAEQFSGVGDIGRGADEQVGAVAAGVAADEGDQAASASQQVGHHAGLAGGFAFGQDVFVGQSGRVQQSGEHVLFLDQDVHGVPLPPEPVHGVLEQVEMGGVAEVEQDGHGAGTISSLHVDKP